jgi:hypothetical protein
MQGMSSGCEELARFLRGWRARASRQTTPAETSNSSRGVQPIAVARFPRTPAVVECLTPFGFRDLRRLLVA